MTSSVLFTPVGINRMTLKNRIVMPAMASYHAAVNGEATENEERAKGGVGMNIVEATYVARSGNSFDLGLGTSDDFMIKGLSKLTDAVHRHDGKIAIQLQHGGNAMLLRADDPTHLHAQGVERRHRAQGRDLPWRSL